MDKFIALYYAMESLESKKERLLAAIRREPLLSTKVDFKELEKRVIASEEEADKC